MQVIEQQLWAVTQASLVCGGQIIAGTWLRQLIELDYGVVCATTNVVYIKDKHNIQVNLNQLNVASPVQAIDAYGQHIAVLFKSGTITIYHSADFSIVKHFQGKPQTEIKFST